MSVISCSEAGSVPAGVCFRKFGALLLSSILAAGASMSLPASAQDDKQKPQTPAPTQTQPANDPSQTQPAADQSQTPPAATQPAANQDNKDTDQPADAKEPAVKHDGGKKDVDAIGNRQVGGLDWYSIE